VAVDVVVDHDHVNDHDEIRSLALLRVSTT
jgi:hypothetical protein